ncbi:hypothetical protein LIER_08508 [Lithospermum erythrorhizon]|uniref:Uncharacterized protein n=1 Tax=Lithospermum erythrorhizon TaxID=34254 RepID=A0AAV3PE73_LITER
MSGNEEVESADGNGVVDDAAGEGSLDSGNEEQQADPSDGESVNSGDSVKIAPDETKVTEDGGKEDMFVDCPDEIENSESQVGSEGMDNQQDAEGNELGNGAQVNDLMAEIEHLRHMLEHTTAERDNYAKKYEEEGKALMELRENFSLKDQETEKYQHVEESASRILASLGSWYQEGNVDESISGKMYHIENTMYFLLEKYNLFLSGIDQLKMALEDTGPDIAMQEEAALFGTACNNILGLKGKVVDLDQKLVQAEHENKQLLAQFQEQKVVVESVNAEISKLKAELEQEKSRYANTKEKLSLAVTKGKALVQQRDSLKQSLAEKTSELAKCLNQLNEKDVILSKCEEILLDIVETEEYQSMDIIEKVKYLTEERTEANRVSLEFRKLVNALSLFDFPETVKLNGLDAKIVWLLESVEAGQQDVSKLQDEIFKMKEAAHDEIGRLSSLLMAETQEKDYHKEELEGLRVKCDKIAASEHQILVEKDRIICMLQEASGVALDDQEKQNQAFSDVAMIVDTCIAKIKDDFSASFNFSNSTLKNFEKMQNLLYISNMNQELYGQILEEVVFGRAELSSLENELVGLRNELNILNGEKDSLQADVERSEEKAGLLREKLSMAVKKGKGLFQERENLRKALDEKNTEIENLQSELQQQTTDCNNIRDQINRLTVDLERIPQLETDILAIQEQKNQVEKYLEESNSMLQKVLESIDSVGLPNDTTFDEPVEKVNWLAGYFSENQRKKILADQELEIAHKEVGKLTDEMEEMKGTVESLKDALSAAERKISGLIEEQEGIAVSKTYVEQELEKAIGESSSLTDKYNEVCASQKSLEDALQTAERNITQLIDEKEAAISSRDAAVVELEKVKEENASKEARELADNMEQVDSTVTSLKNALSEAESEISRLTEEKEGLSVSKTYIEEELKKAIEESSSLTNKYAEVCASQKSLEDALQAAERNIAQLIDEKETAISSKTAAEIELVKVKEEVTSKEARDLNDEKEDVQITVKSLKEALSAAESKISELEEENESLTVSKSYLEQQLQKAIEESSSLTDKFDEVCSNKKSLEDSLQAAERNITQLTEEKEAAISSSTATAIELEKVKEEITVQTSKLSEAERLKQSLEDSLSQAQENLLILTEDNKKAESNKTDLENELRKLKEEVDSHVLGFSNANSTIKSLQDSLSSADEKVSGLVNEKKNAEEEISSLNLKLNACLEELAGTHGSLESSSMELSGHLSTLRRLLKDETLSSSLLQSFEKKFGVLNDMNLILQEVRESIIEVDSEILQSFSSAEDEASPSTIPSSGLDYLLDFELSNGEENSTDADNIVFYIGKTVERLQLRDKVLAEKVERLSAFMDNLILSLSKKLRIVKVMPELIKPLKQKVDDLESDRQALEDNIFMLESSNGTLLPACTDATKQLKLEFEQCLSELKSNSHLLRLYDTWSIDLDTLDENSVGEDQLSLGSNNYVKAAKDILFAARQSRDLNRHFQNVVNKMIITIDHLQNELQESKTTGEKLLEERNLSENEVMKLKKDLEKSENACNEMRMSLEDYEQRENDLMEREAEISSKSASSLKLEEVEGYYLTASQKEFIFDKINRLDVSPTERDTGNLQFHDSPDVEKLCYVVDSYAGLKDQISLLSGEKEKLHTIIDNQVSEIKHLKEESEEHYNYINEKEKMKNELLDLATGLESIIQKLGGDESADYKKEVAGITGLLQVLETRVVASKLESRNLKAKSEELNYKLLEMQKVVDYLSSKNRLSVDSSRSTESIHERGVLESSSSPGMSEISEIQDMVSVGKNKSTPAIPPVQSAPHPRTLRKGSADHLSINVDSDSELLIKEDKNVNKGHVFKSLNTSGLIPRQGKVIADRVDGIWVSGSNALMNHPRARLGLVTYWLLMHLWLLGSIL